MVSFSYISKHCIVLIILLHIYILGYTAASDETIPDNSSPDHQDHPTPTPYDDQGQAIPTDAPSLPPDILKALASPGRDTPRSNHHIPWSPQDHITTSNYEKLLYSAEDELYFYPPDKRNVAKGLKTLRELSRELSAAIHWLEPDDRALRRIVLDTLQEEDPLSNRHRRRRRRSSILKQLSALHKQQQALVIASNTCLLSDKPNLKASLLPMHQQTLSDNTSPHTNNTGTAISQDSTTTTTTTLHHPESSLSLLIPLLHHHKVPSLVSSYLANQPGRSKLLKDTIQVGSYNLTDIPGLAAAGDAAFLLASIISSGSGLGLPSSSLLLPSTNNSSGTSSGSTINAESVAIKLIHHAAMSSSLEASLSLIDRYRTGRGGLPIDVPGSLERAVITMTHLASILDASGGIGAAGGSVLLRNSWMEGGYKTEEGGWLLWDGYDDPHTLNYERDMADRGDAEALRQMGYRQLLGQGLDADGGAAAAAFAAAAAAGDPYALFNEGYMAFQGQHMPRNYTLAKLRFHQAAVLGIHASYNGLGAVYYHGEGNFTMARYYFEKGVELGDQDSMFNLATMYKDGIIAQLEGGGSSSGDGRNMTYAVELYNLAESQGHWRSSQELTKIYTYGVPPGSSSIGTTIEKNYTRAFISYDKFTRNIKHWRDGLKDAAMVYLEEGDAWGAGVRYALLAEQGCPEAMLNLGWLMTMEKKKKEVMGVGGGDSYDNNNGGPGELFRRAGELGKSQGWLLAGHHMMKKKMHGDSGNSDSDSDTNSSLSALLAVEYYHKAANMSNVEALYTLGWLYEQGSPVMDHHHHHLERDVDKARWYYKEAVDASVAFRYAVAPWLAMMTMDVRRWGRERWERVGNGVQQMIMMVMMMQWDVVVLVVLGLMLGCVLYLKMKKKNRKREGEDDVVDGGSA